MPKHFLFFFNVFFLLFMSKILFHGRLIDSLSHSGQIIIARFHCHTNGLGSSYLNLNAAQYCISVMAHHDPCSEVQVLLSFSTFSRPTTVPLGSGYEVLHETFLSVYGHHIDVLRKFIIQIYSDDWGQYIDFPEGFTILNKARLRLVPLQSEVRRHQTDMVCLKAFHNKAFPNCFPNICE